MIKKSLSWLLVFALAAASLAAKDEKKNKNRLIFSPIIFYTPETRLAFGAAASYIFRPAGCDEFTRPSSFSPIIIYTLEKQFKIQANTALYFKDNDYRVEAELKFEKYPNKFFGIGNHTAETEEETYTSKGINFLVSLYKKLGAGIFIGLGYHFTDWDIADVDEDGQLVSGKIPGSEEGTISGVRLLLELDTRDHLFYPRKGHFIKFEARSYLEFLGSTFAYTTFTIDLRKYIPVFSSHVFAVQSLARVQGGTVPFLHMAQLGGQYLLRGYFEGRYRDKSLLAIQADYRIPLFWRLGVVGFVGFGNVAAQLKKLNFGEFKSAYGVGVRYLFSKTEKIWIRLDLGFAEGKTGFYASIYEAF